MTTAKATLIVAAFIVASFPLGFLLRNSKKTALNWLIRSGELGGGISLVRAARPPRLGTEQFMILAAE